MSAAPPEVPAVQAVAYMAALIAAVQAVGDMPSPEMAAPEMAVQAGAEMAGVQRATGVTAAAGMTTPMRMAQTRTAAPVGVTTFRQVGPGGRPLRRRPRPAPSLRQVPRRGGPLRCATPLRPSLRQIAKRRRVLRRRPAHPFTAHPDSPGAATKRPSLPNHRPPTCPNRSHLSTRPCPRRPPARRAAT